MDQRQVFFAGVSLDADVDAGEAEALGEVYRHVGRCRGWRGRGGGFVG
jgi:hypothetical protein